MKKIIVLIICLAAAGSFLQAQDDRELMEKAKLAIFDKQWQPALTLLESAISRFPKSPLYDSFAFYKGRCLEELKQQKPALAAYDEYIRIGRNEDLIQEAQSSRIDISFDLFKKGERQYLKNILDLLKSPDPVCRFYAAFKLSYSGEKSVAAAALPVLEKIVREESDPELKDKAKLAILRIDPSHLTSASPSEARQPQMRFLVIEIKGKGMQSSATIRVPLALADLALKSLDADAKEQLKAKGYDINQLLKDMSHKPGTILEIREGDELIRIKIE